MSETPEEWLGRLFEFCAECGGDSEDQEISIVPAMGTYFARCLRAESGEPTDHDRCDTGRDAVGAPRRPEAWEE
ncbi:MAG: hypothetical protein BGO49_22590 [Planctomycetales bacterium 71-10]|nr:MAG: hypothetical protein BGO49_22590 [Planctomycetales bacterium 71-10]